MKEGYGAFLAKKEERFNRLKETCGEILRNKDHFTLEIGCGHGHWLVSYARKNPKEFCVGIDLISRRINKSNQKRNMGELENVVFLKAEATEFLEALPKTIRILKTCMIFPDPWPKKRHHKRRLIQECFLDKLSILSVNNGHFYFRTDHQDYFEWTRDKIAHHPDWETIETFSWPLETETYFQSTLEGYQSMAAIKTGPQSR